MASSMQVAPRVTRHSLTRFQRAPKILRKLRRNPKTGLPTPHVKIVTREFAPCRLEEHYHTTLKDDLMYMTYKHQIGERPPPRQIRMTFDPEDPYSKFRHNVPVGGSQFHKKPAPPSTPDNVVRLEKIQLHTMVKEAMKALTGETFQGGGHHAVEGIQVVRAKKSVGGWIRPGVPVGVKVDLKGQAISVSGVVSFGLPPSALVFFPQIEVNVDAYPKLVGMHIHFITNATGVGAQDRAVH
ncbi:60s ribosomal protein l7 [Pholiota molesta]|nr:60s ribosomal protein l7 [Pholiota molesta]